MNPKTELSLEDSASAREVAALIREIQPTLLEFTAALLGGAEGTEDVVQETNMFLWERRGDFQIGTNFRAWALKVARFKAMAAQRDRAREHQVVFSEELMERLAARAEQQTSGSERRLGALTHCLSRIRIQDRRLLEWKYVRKESLTELAGATGQAANSVHKRISRLRLALRQCIEKSLSKRS